jgi:hypothetical protein
MKKNDLMMILAVGAGGYLLYWYLTKNGPNGAVFNAAGQPTGAPSYWDSWFGGGTPAGSTVVMTPTGQTVVVPTTTTTNPVVTQTGTTATDVRTRLLTASGGQNNLTADQWNYYRNQLFPPALSPQAFGAAFPVRTDPMPSLSIDQFLAALNAAGINAAAPGTGGGLSGMGRIGNIVPVPSVASIPSMSFGGSLAQAVPGSPSAFRGGFNPGGRGQGGGYVQ